MLLHQTPQVKMLTSWSIIIIFKSLQGPKQSVVVAHTYGHVAGSILIPICQDPILGFALHRLLCWGNLVSLACCWVSYSFLDPRFYFVVVSPLLGWCNSLFCWPYDMLLVDIPKMLNSSHTCTYSKHIMENIFSLMILYCKWMGLCLARQMSSSLNPFTISYNFLGNTLVISPLVIQEILTFPVIFTSTNLQS